MKLTMIRLVSAALLVTGVHVPSVIAAGDSIVEANVKVVAAGEEVAVARIPDGIYLRSVNDPDDIIWERLPEYRVHLAPAPAVHPSVELRQKDGDQGQDVYFTLARTSDRFYVRLRWRDDSRDTATGSNRFRDGAAVQFSIGDDSTSYVMGSGQEDPVNIWYWRSDSNAVESLGAGGPGSTTRLDDQPVTGDARYQTGEKPGANQWIVVMSRPIAVTGAFQVPLNRSKVPMAFALWQGATAQRDGLKNVSEDWIVADLGEQQQ